MPDPLSLAPPTTVQVLHDVRAIVDVCDLDIARIASAPGERWVVLAVQPDSYSGSASIPGIVVDGDTGQLVDSAGAPADLGQPAVVLHDGSYRLLTTLTPENSPISQTSRTSRSAEGSAAGSGRYSWSEPQPGRTTGVPADAVYDPFADGGTVVCRQLPGGATAPFADVRLLPQGWESDVADAVGAARPDPADAAGDPRDRLRAQAASGNDVLFAQSVHTLARLGDLDEHLLETLHGQTDGYRRAVLTFATLRHPSPATADAVRAQLATDLSGADHDHRRAAALGLLAARLFAPGQTPAVVPAPARAGAREVPADRSAPGDGYVDESLRLLAPA